MKILRGAVSIALLTVAMSGAALALGGAPSARAAPVYHVVYRGIIYANSINGHITLTGYFYGVVRTGVGAALKAPHF